MNEMLILSIPSQCGLSHSFSFRAHLPSLLCDVCVCVLCECGFSFDSFCLLPSSNFPSQIPEAEREKTIDLENHHYHCFRRDFSYQVTLDWSVGWLVGWFFGWFGFQLVGEEARSWGSDISTLGCSLLRFQDLASKNVKMQDAIFGTYLYQR